MVVRNDDDEAKIPISNQLSCNCKNLYKYFVEFKNEFSFYPQQSYFII